ncbi:phosphatidate cytidylyltransferase [bacterium]|nr:phosphatidate cytidylyltransferase [bacterium]
MQISELGKRLFVAIIAIPFIFFLIFLGDFYFLAFLIVVASMMLKEFYEIAERKSSKPNKILGISFTILFGVSLYFNIDILVFLLLFTLIVPIIELFRNKVNPIMNSMITIAGLLYTGLFFSLFLIRQLPINTVLDYSTGAWLIILIFISIWICDTAAYGFGSWIGKNPLFKRISPNKTWEGATAGFVFGIISSVIIQKLFIPQLLLVDGIVIGIIVGVVGQLGDLVESMFKRDAGVKDSSKLLPGHGGILDRFDSPLLVAPLTYIYLLLRFV